MCVRVPSPCHCRCAIARPRGRYEECKGKLLPYLQQVGFKKSGMAITNMGDHAPDDPANPRQRHG